MDFFTSTASPIAINIDGTAYQLPRFLNPALKEWSAILRKQKIDEAIEHLSPEDRARFLSVAPAVTIDIVEIMRRSLSPEGAEYVVDSQMKKAGVPDELRRKVMDTADPYVIRQLSEQLTMAEATMSQLGVAPEESTDPLPPGPGASGASPETGPETSPASTPSTAA